MAGAKFYRVTYSQELVVLATNKEAAEELFFMTEEGGGEDTTLLDIEEYDGAVMLQERLAS